MWLFSGGLWPAAMLPHLASCLKVRSFSRMFGDWILKTWEIWRCSSYMALGQSPIRCLLHTEVINHFWRPLGCSQGYRRGFMTYWCQKKSRSQKTSHFFEACCIFFFGKGSAAWINNWSWGAQIWLPGPEARSRFPPSKTAKTCPKTFDQPKGRPYLRALSEVPARDDLSPCHRIAP